MKPDAVPSALTPEVLADVAKGLGEDYRASFGCLWRNDDGQWFQSKSLPDLAAACKKVLREAKVKYWLDYDARGLCSAIIGGGRCEVADDDDTALLLAFAEWVRTT
jgi:hypothetical protein